MLLQFSQNEIGMDCEPGFQRQQGKYQGEECTSQMEETKTHFKLLESPNIDRSGDKTKN